MLAAYFDSNSSSIGGHFDIGLGTARKPWNANLGELTRDPFRGLTLIADNLPIKGPFTTIRPLSQGVFDHYPFGLNGDLTNFLQMRRGYKREAMTYEESKCMSKSTYVYPDKTRKTVTCKCGYQWETMSKMACVTCPNDRKVVRVSR